MKRFFSALMVMALLLITIPANAQLKFGVKGGLNISQNQCIKGYIEE